MVADVDTERLQLLGMLASALAGRPLAVAAGGAGEPSWTDGQTVFVDPSARARANLESVAVHASLLAADSLTPDVVDQLIRRPKLAKRYLAVEGDRKSTRLNSSHSSISYAVFCLKKKKKI